MRPDHGLVGYYPVLDASAAIAYLLNEEGADTVEAYILNTRPCAIHALNAYEVHNLTARRSGSEAADEAIRTIKDAGILIFEDIDEEFWKEAARHKVEGRISPPDTFAIALANRLGGEVITCDREFEAIRDRNICRVTFFRPPRAT